MKNIQHKDLHKQFIQLGRERNRITYKLLALLPKIYKGKVYEAEGYATIYDYAARIAGLSPGVVTKAIKLEKKLQNMPHLQKRIETQGINKVGIIAGLATEENEKELADKVDHMSKPALQEYSKESRGKLTTNWQVELDEEMMFMFLKLKKKFGKNLSNKECLRKILEGMQEKPNPNLNPNPKKVEKSQNSKKTEKIPGEILVQIDSKNRGFQNKKSKFRYTSVSQKEELGDRCAHLGCCRPAEVFHHIDRFSEHHNNKNQKPLCKEHHEFAHNGIIEPMHPADYQYRKHRQAVLL